MKTYKIIPTIIMTFIFGSSFGQFAYYDAIKISQMNPQSIDGRLKLQYKDTIALQDILSNYTSAVTYRELVQEFSANPFFTLPKSSSHSITDNSQKLSGKTDILGNVAGLNATTVADGIAKFLVARSKEELSITFFERFKKLFKIYPEFKVLFPNTSKSLTVIESYNYSAYLNVLKAAFKIDINNLQKTLPKIENLEESDCENDACKLRVKNYQEFFKTDKSRLLKMLLVFVGELQNGSDPAQILTTIATSTDFNALDSAKYKNIKNSVYFIELLSSSLKSTNENEVWVSKNELEKLINSPTALHIYLGLIYQLNINRNKPIEWVKSSGSNLELQQLLIDVASNKARIENYLRELADKMATINATLQTIKNVRYSTSNIDPSAYYVMQSSLVSLIRQSSDLSDFNIELEYKKENRKFIELTETAGTIYNDLSLRNYSSAVFNFRILLADLSVGNSEFYNNFLKYASFMAAVAEAENSDQVQDAIESIALPAGSARIKRETQWNFSLNAYIGGFTGTEKLDGLVNNKNGKVSGINAPIGIALSKGLRCGKTELGSITAMLSIVDIGAVTAYRFENDSTANLPEFKFQNIFAPGLHIIYGLPKIPISIGYGYQLGPALREINSLNIEIDPKPTRRQAFFIAIDIPLINFYTKSR